MKVDLALAVGQFRHQSSYTLRCHVPAPGDAEAVVGGRHARRPHLSPQHARPVIQRVCPRSDRCAAAREDRGRLGWNTHAVEAELPADFEHQPPHRRMQMHMLVRISVMQHEPGRSERGELRADLGGELAANARPGEVAHAKT